MQQFQIVFLLGVHESQNILKIAILFAISLAFVPILADAQVPQTDEPIKEVSPIKYVLGIGLIVVIILAIIAGRYRKKFLAESLQSEGWSEVQKEQVRIRQDGLCAMCQKLPPARWEYHHKDGDSSNNSLENCEGLCPNCYSVKTHD